MRVALLGLAALAAAGSSVVLPALADAQGPEKLLIFIPGGKVPNENYTLTSQAIQRAAKHIRLTVVVPSVFNNLCIIECSSPKICSPLKATVDAAVKLANVDGRPYDLAKDAYLAGHSLGATCANYLMQGYTTDAGVAPYAGLVVMGGYVDEQGKASLPSYSVPLLTLGAELDGGLARPAKLALWARQSREEGEKSAKASWTKPVIVLPDIDHSDFCPGFAVPGDLPSASTREAALASIGKAVAAFLTVQVGSDGVDEAKQTLQELSTQSDEIMGPVLKALDMETLGGNGLFTPGASSQWCARAQQKMAGLSPADASLLTVEDSYKAGGHEFEHSRVHYELLSSGQLRVNTTSHCTYNTDIQNVGLRSAANDVACKLIGANRVANELKVKTNTSVTCGDINREAVAVAESLASRRVYERYAASGRKWCFLEDKTVTGNIGPLFLLTGITLEERADCLAVAALKLQTELDSNIFPGVHYCKVLSPARALDWIMTDSLKKQKKQDAVTLII
jgi:hypothetical protein